MGKNLEYFKVNFYIAWKIGIEYKLNFITSLIQMFGFMIVHITIMYITYFAVGDVIGWNFEKFVLFYFLTYMATIISGLFTFNKYFHADIVKGNLNPYLTMPMNVYVAYVLSRLSPWAILSFFVRTCGLIFTVIYFEIELNNLFYAFLILVLSNLMYFVLYQFFDSLEFRKKRLSEVVKKQYYEVYTIVNVFPALYFSKIGIKNIFLLVPTYIMSLIIVPLIYGTSITNFKLEIILSILFIILAGFFAIVNWKYGLKNYEAYG